LEIKSYSFIVRIWNEAMEGGENVWRGSIEKVGNDGKQYFSHLDGMVGFIQDQIGFVSPAKAKARQSFLQRIRDAFTKH
jgi:hypothetical protein